MFASVRIEGFAFNDPRFIILAQKGGLADRDHARGKLERVWGYCTFNNARALRVDIFDAIAEWPGLALAAVQSELADQLKNGLVRIRGVEGRIEWLEKLRQNAVKGGGQTRAKWQAKRQAKTQAKRGPDEGPLTLTLSPSLSPSPDLREEPPNAPHGGAVDPVPAAPRKRKLPGLAGASPAEREAIANVLRRLSERSGRQYGADTPSHALRILRLLRTGHTEQDLRMVVWDRANRWSGDDRMDEYLRPSTLFGPQKFPDYLAEAKAAYEQRPDKGARPPPRSASVGDVLRGGAT